MILADRVGLGKGVLKCNYQNVEIPHMSKESGMGLVSRGRKDRKIKY